MTGMFWNALKFLLAFPFARMQWRLGRSRPPKSHTELIAELVHRGCDRDLSEAVMIVLRPYVVDERAFSPYPDDSLGRVFGVGEEELELDTICDTCRKFSLPVPTQAFVDEFYKSDTIFDVVYFLTLWRLRNTVKV